MSASEAAGSAPLLRRKAYQEGCPACQHEKKMNSHQGVPIREFLYIWIACLCSTLPIQSLFPYLYFMIRDLHIAKHEQDIGFYAGFVGASYFFGRTFTAVAWGIFADRHGRKPVIVISIASVVAFITLFGLSTSYWMAITTRGLLGVLCGLLGPIKAYASEVGGEEHQALGLSVVTSSRAIAFVVGPAIGGFLAEPAKKYPHLFSEDSIFGRFPYLLPNLTIAVIALGAFFACLWLPETLHMHKQEYVVLGDIASLEEHCAATQSVAKRSSEEDSKKKLLKNWPLLTAITIYCVFSLYDTAYNEIFSLWAISNRKYGGLSFSSADVGLVLCISGIGLLVYQLALYPCITRQIGPIKPFRTVTVLSLLLVGIYPFMNNLYGLQLKISVNIASLLKNIFSATITTACNILQNDAVIQQQRGVANGISVTLMSIFKAIAPAAAGILFSWAQNHYNDFLLSGDGILFLGLNIVGIVGLLFTFLPYFALQT